MPDRLSPLDASFLFAEHRTAAMHVGAVMTFAPPERGPFDLDDLRRADRAAVAAGAAVPAEGARRPRPPRAAGVGRRPGFDLAFHVRRSALPAPGTEQVLRELVGRLLARQLDRSRPLWEVYLIEGLADGRFAVVTKTHHAMVDGLASMDIGAVLLDPTPQPRENPPDDWDPAPEPSALELAANAVLHALRRPRDVLDVAGRAVSDVQQAVAAVGRVAEAVLAAGRSAAAVRPVPPLTAATGEQRRYGMERTTLADHRAVRKAHGGTVNDVVLAVVAGALRRWMISRGEPLTSDVAVRALVPVSVRARRRDDGGNSISAYFVDLPVAEPDPVRRLALVRAAMEEHKRSGRAISATAMVGLVGLAPPIVHSLGARLASQFSSRLYNVLVTNVPGPPGRSTRWAPGCWTCSRWCRWPAARRWPSASPPTTAACTTA